MTKIATYVCVPKTQGARDVLNFVNKDLDMFFSPNMEAAQRNLIRYGFHPNNGHMLRVTWEIMDEEQQKSAT